MARVLRRPVSPRAALAAFFALAFGYSWSFWIAAALSAARAGGAADMRLIYAGIPGPLVAACLLLFLTAAPGERRDFWRRIYEVERLRPGWFAAVVLVYPAATALAVGFDVLLGGVWPDMELASSIVRDPVLLLSFGTSALLLGPLPEEPGWRGYALDRLLKAYGALTASVLLGLLWALWHLPLFFAPGTYQYGLGFGTMRFALFNVTAVVSSILITWIYQHNGRSTCAAILFHWIVNLTGATVALAGRGDLIRTALLTLLAGVVVLCDARSGSTAGDPPRSP